MLLERSDESSQIILNMNITKTNVMIVDNTNQREKSVDRTVWRLRIEYMGHEYGLRDRPLRIVRTYILRLGSESILSK